MSNLVISRRIGQTIVIDEQIIITLLETKGGQIRVSIEAPRSISIRRGELSPKNSQTDSA